MHTHRTAALAAALAATTLTVTTALADEDSLRREMNERLAEMEARHRNEMAELRKSLAAGAGAAPSALQEQIDRLADDLDGMKAKLPAASAAGRTQFRLIDVSLITLAVAGTSTAPESVVQELQQGGHDPKKRGFTVPNVELVFTGAVDPWFTAQANIVTLLSSDGETEVELEEAFATTSSLPAGLQVKAGQFFTAFGRHNPQHPHAWDFVDAPVVNTRILGGDGMRGPGAQVSWLGTDVPLELTASVQNANGETMASFLSEEPPVGSPVAREVRSFSDTTFVGRAAWSIDATDEVPLLLGVSGAWGPSGASSGGDARVVGVDLTAKWRPLDAEGGFPFVAFRTEWIRRRYEFDDPAGLLELDDSGWYAQTVWGFRRGWTVGARYDRFRGGAGPVTGLDDRTRWSAALTWHTSEFSKLRLQVNRDRAETLERDVTSVWLQIEFDLGQHGAHKF